jgi:hypothetical protein
MTTIHHTSYKMCYWSYLEIFVKLLHPIEISYCLLMLLEGDKGLQNVCFKMVTRAFKRVTWRDRRASFQSARLTCCHFTSAQA